VGQAAVGLGHTAVTVSKVGVIGIEVALSGPVAGSRAAQIGAVGNLKLRGEAPPKIDKLPQNFTPENIVTYSSLVRQLNREVLEHIASLDYRLRIAVYGDGTGNLNFQMGSASVAEANALGRAWVGEGARPMTGVQGGLVSADGMRIYRPPSLKPNSSYAKGRMQANFVIMSKKPEVISNAHLNIE